MQSSVYVGLLTQLVLFQHLHKQTKKKLKISYFKLFFEEPEDTNNLFITSLKSVQISSCFYS